MAPLAVRKRGATGAVPRFSAGDPALVNQMSSGFIPGKDSSSDEMMARPLPDTTCARPCVARPRQAVQEQGKRWAMDRQLWIGDECLSIRI